MDGLEKRELEVPAEQVTRVRQRRTSAGSPNSRGCLAFVVLGITAGTAVWLWYRHETVFPAELRLGFEVYATFYRDLAVAAVILVGLSWLWALRSSNSPEARGRAILATIIVAGEAVFLAWLWTQAHIGPPARDAQVREIATWASLLACMAVLFRLFNGPIGGSRRRMSDAERDRDY